MVLPYYMYLKNKIKELKVFLTNYWWYFSYSLAIEMYRRFGKREALVEASLYKVKLFIRLINPNRPQNCFRQWELVVFDNGNKQNFLSCAGILANMSNLETGC